MRKRHEMPPVGHVFGLWTVVEALPSGSHQMVRVRCECGTVSDRRLTHLLSGRSSCCQPCSYRARQKSYTPEYEAWLALIQRCTNPKNPRWDDYGGRGITVCDRWRASFDDFLADVGPRPSPAHSIDRMDNDKGYEPGNCRWATRRDQMMNRRVTKRRSSGGSDA